GPNRTWDRFDRVEWQRILDVNITGAMNVIAAALPSMRRAGGGSFIHTSSWAGRFHALRAGVPYGASKHALNELSAGLNDARDGTASARPSFAPPTWRPPCLPAD